jgi:multidrug efflux pump subunit AcrB
VSINMISLFAFILALGIVVDDAIVIGEGIFARQEEGQTPVRAAVEGATRLAMPVTFAVLTTVAAFAPLLFVPGIIGKFMRNLPVIIIAVLLFSLVESLFILPAHLAHVKATRGGKKNAVAAFIERIQARVARALEWNIRGPLTTGLTFSTRHYGLVIVSAFATILLAVGLVAGGFIKFSFFPDIEGENVVARIELPEGTRASETARIAGFIEQRGRDAIGALQATLPEEHPSLITNTFIIVGEQPFQEQSGPDAGGGPGLTQSHLAEINFELLAAERRDISAETIEQAWREAVGPISNVRTIAFQSAVFSLGKPIQAEISAPTPELVEQAVARFKAELAQFAGVFEIEDNRKPGKREVKLSLKPQARPLGLTLDDLARQVRSAFYGDEALRIQRGRDDIRVMVRLPEDERDALDDLLDLRIRTPQGGEVPFGEVAAASFGYGPSNINRRDRRRVVTVTANLDAEVVTAQEVVADLDQRVIPDLQREVPGTRISFEGEQREQADTMAALGKGFAVALFLIYALLAIPLRSYVQPLVIMSVIPFGIIGAILGHLFMGLSVGILSMFGIIGLSGVVVNDSLVLIDYINQARREGLPMREAIIQAGQLRFRPILLTSLTTFLGVLPLILERSLQAQFLVPIAVSLGFGILFATFIVLLLVPALVMLQYDAGQAFRRLLGREADEDHQSNGHARGEIVLPEPMPLTTDH